MKISKETVNSNPFIKQLLTAPEYTSQAAQILNDTITGSELDRKCIIAHLLKLACAYCGISLGYRTLLYDFAWAVLNHTPEYWSPQEIENEMSDLSSRIGEFYTEYHGELDQYDVTTMSVDEYLDTAIEFLECEATERDRPILCLGLYMFCEDMSKH